MKIIEKIWDLISRWLFEVVAVLGLLIMLIIAFGNVLSRYLLPVSWAFTEELTCGLFILVSMLGAALAVRDGKAMGISLLTDLLPQRFQKYVTIVQAIFTGLFGYLLLEYGIGMVKSELRLKMKTAALGWPEAIFGSFVPIGGAALIIASVCLVIKSIKEIKAKHDKKEANE
ncbi:MAG: TRAP transporter small permease [Oscillospiraceae bacterium]|nr:TRAP transporter small permease [Oscillospiraceae bacterium]MBQ4538108.1 TRAP transporter small permease [Oscillospiraceae bacterium]